MDKPKIYVHGSYVGNTGYNNHTRDFFRELSKYCQLKVRNFTVGDSWNGYSETCHDGEKYLDELDKELLYKQILWVKDDKREDFTIYPSEKKEFVSDFNIILNETNHHVYYDDYNGPVIGFNVWESTRQPDYFFQRLQQFDELWVPSKWQRDVTIEQGYDPNKIKVVPEGVDVHTFFPEKVDLLDEYKDGRFKFILFGRWDYRKSTKEIIETFLKTFSPEEPVDLVVSIDNMWGEQMDGYKSTEERLQAYGLTDPRVKIIHFPKRSDYIKFIKTGHVFVSCARSEGWNLPLCVPKNKLIFTNQKFIPINDVKVGDLVISHEGNEKRVIELMKREYDGELVNIKLYGDYEELSLTPEHPVYTIKREEFITKKDKFKIIQDIEPKWIESKNIQKGDIIIRTELPQKYFEDKVIDLLSIDVNLKYDDEYVWYKTGYNSNSELKKIKRYVKLWDLVYLFGWYISEGTDGKNRLIFTLNANKEVDVAIKILSEIKRIFGVTGNYKIKNNTLIVKISSVLLCKFFTHFCNKLSYNKKIPQEILLGPKKVLSELINNMFLGDGNKKDDIFLYTTVSEILTRQLIFANQRLGIKSRAQLNKRKRVSKRPCYTISWNENNLDNRHSNKMWSHPKGFAILVKNVEKSSYNDYVYNIEVEDDNSYLLSNATVHNCEAMACGTPSIYSNCSAQLEFAKGKGIPVNVIGEKPANQNDYGRYTQSDLPGNFYEPDFNELSEKMRFAYEFYTEVKEKALEESIEIRNNFSWEVIGEIGAKACNDFYNKINSPEYNRGKKENEVIITFMDGPRVEIKGDIKKEYFIEFIDGDDKVVYSTRITNNMWTACGKKYFIPWKIRINGVVHKLDLRGKVVLISFESKSIGDTIAWAPYVLEFRKKHDCIVVLSTFHNDWFKGAEAYKDIVFIEPGGVVDCFAVYRIGYFKSESGKWDDLDRYPTQLNTLPLQQTASDILGLPFEEINHGINFTPSSRPQKNKYVVIAPESTAGCKEWVYENWVELSGRIMDKGYDVICLTSKPFYIPGVKNICGAKWKEVFNYLHHSEFLIGLSSGLAWVNWALNKMTVMICGFSETYNEFQSNCIRITNNICIKCWNDSEMIFDGGDWDWCPVYKGTKKQHICQKSITVDQVYNKLPL